MNKQLKEKDLTYLFLEERNLIYFSILLYDYCLHFFTLKPQKQNSHNIEQSRIQNIRNFNLTIVLHPSCKLYFQEIILCLLQITLFLYYLHFWLLLDLVNFVSSIMLVFNFHINFKIFIIFFIFSQINLMIIHF